MHAFESNRYAHSKLKSTHKVTTHNTHTEHDTHSVYVYMYTKSITNIVTMGDYTIVMLYPCLPILHLLSVHPGSQTQVPGLLQTPFSQGGTQTAEERTI